MAVKHRLTVEEFLVLPDMKPYREYCDGRVTQKMAADLFHGGVASRLVREISLYADDYDGFSGPEMRVLLPTSDETRIYVADIAFWAKGRPLGERRAGSPPTLAVEIRSPGESLASQREKCRFYRAAGVPVAWFVEPDARTVQVFEDGVEGSRTLTEADTLTSAFLPGFAYPLKELFSILDRFE